MVAKSFVYALALLWACYPDSIARDPYLVYRDDGEGPVFIMTPTEEIAPMIFCNREETVCPV